MKTFAPLLHSYWYLFRGAGMTLLMASAAVVPATLLGVLLALAQIFGSRLTRSAIVGYIFIIRGIPLLVLLTFVYYLLPLTGIDLPPFWGVVLVLACYYAAFMSEAFRAGILSLAAGAVGCGEKPGHEPPADAADRDLSRRPCASRRRPSSTCASI